MFQDCLKKMVRLELTCHVLHNSNIGLDIHQKLVDIKVASIAIQIKEPSRAFVNKKSSN